MRRELPRQPLLEWNWIQSGRKLSTRLAKALRPCTLPAWIMGAGACALVGGMSAAAEEGTRFATNEAIVSNRDCSVMNFPVSWSAPEKLVVPMKIRNGLPTVYCSLNGHAVWLIVDTGSQECVLEAATARDAGVRIIDQRRAQIQVTGIGGKEMALVGVPDSISIGTWHCQDLPCIVRATPPVATETGWFSRRTVAFNLLGMSALRAMCSYVTLDYQRREVVFGFKGAFQPTRPATAAHQPFEMRHGVPFVKVSHAGHEWSALLDTGASPKMDIDRSTAEQVGPGKRFRWVNATHVGLGKSDNPKQGRFGRLTLESVWCLGRSWRNVDAMLVEDESKIGSGLCRGFRLTVDFTGSQVWLETPGSRSH